MDNIEFRIENLVIQLEKLLQQQAHLAKEINLLRFDINKLRNEYKTMKPEPVSYTTQASTTDQTLVHKEETHKTAQQIELLTIDTQRPSETSAPGHKKETSRSIESFIGSNLISKIGILITIVGVIIGIKYSIDHDLISPLMRIIFAYLTGFGLLATGYKLKSKYTNYSAVLVSGATAILYFTTYIAYSFYQLLPQAVAFAGMVAITIYTVRLALKYNQQVIAIIGQVGAYAIPFMLSENSGKVLILFCYITIINIGILLVSIRKYWNLLHYISFFFSWLILATWQQTSYDVSRHFYIAIVFSSLFFLIFYAISIGYKIRKKQELQIMDVALLLINSFAYFGIGYEILKSEAVGQHLLGVFSVLNSVIHFASYLWIRRQQAFSKIINYLPGGLSLVFITIAVPVQFDGQWVTLLWIGEAFILYWIGTKKQISWSVWASYVAMTISFISLLQDMQLIGHTSENFTSTPFLNIRFVTNFIVSAVFLFINFHHYSTKRNELKNFHHLATSIITVITLFIIYQTFAIEIEYFWSLKYENSHLMVKEEHFYNQDFRNYSDICLGIYRLLFLAALSFLNNLRFRERSLAIFGIVISTAAAIYFMGNDLNCSSNLIDNYMSTIPFDHYSHSILSVVVHYLLIGSFITLAYQTYQIFRQSYIEPFSPFVKSMYIYFAGFVGFILVGSEFNTILDLFNYRSTSLGTTILWAIYALTLIIWGIGKRIKHLRYLAMGIFSITTLKLFFIDLEDTNTLEKTVVFIALGIILLVTSFLYNKYLSWIQKSEE